MSLNLQVAKPMVRLRLEATHLLGGLGGKGDADGRLIAFDTRARIQATGANP
jgi:hypothetical protein